MAGALCHCTPQIPGLCAWCRAMLARAEPHTAPPQAPWGTVRTLQGPRQRTSPRTIEVTRGLPGHIALVLSPLRVQNPLNGAHDGSRALRAQMRRHQQERQAAYFWLRHWCPGFPAAWSAVTVRLTRVAPRMLDDDNLQAALKHVRDGVADWWDGKEQGGNDRQHSLTWEYRQTKGGPGQYEVEIFITPQKN